MFRELSICVLLSQTFCDKLFNLAFSILIINMYSSYLSSIIETLNMFTFITKSFFLLFDSNLNIIMITLWIVKLFYPWTFSIEYSKSHWAIDASRRKFPRFSASLNSLYSLVSTSQQCKCDWRNSALELENERFRLGCLFVQGESEMECTIQDVWI